MNSDKNVKRPELEGIQVNLRRVKYVPLSTKKEDLSLAWSENFKEAAIWRGFEKLYSGKPTVEAIEDAVMSVKDPNINLFMCNEAWQSAAQSYIKRYERN